jgi:hypothetical protein
MKTENRILARVVAREITVAELEAVNGGGGLTKVDIEGKNNSSSITTCGQPHLADGTRFDGGADD